MHSMKYHSNVTPSSIYLHSVHCLAKALQFPTKSYDSCHDELISSLHRFHAKILIIACLYSLFDVDTICHLLQKHKSVNLLENSKDKLNSVLFSVIERIMS